MCVLSIKVPIRQNSGNLLSDSCNSDLILNIIFKSKNLNPFQFVWVTSFKERKTKLSENRLRNLQIIIKILPDNELAIKCSVSKRIKKRKKRNAQNQSPLR